VERAFDGNVRALSGRRDACARGLEAKPELDTAARERIVATLESAGPDEIPAIFLVHCEGYVAVGIRRLNGGLVSVS
jgi:hypothetical protein